MNSGRVDGASEFQVFLRIVLPQLKPGLMALGIWMFITRMKAYYWPLIILREPEVQVAQVWITALLGSGATPNPYPVILPSGDRCGGTSVRVPTATPRTGRDRYSTRGRARQATPRLDVRPSGGDEDSNMRNRRGLAPGAVRRLVGRHDRRVSRTTRYPDRR